MIRGSTALGFCIAGVIAVGAFVAVRDFENDWFMRAAPQKAAECFSSKLACRHLMWDQDIQWTAATSRPQSALCRTPAGWHRIFPPHPERTTQFVICRDGETYLFHLGIFASRYRNGAQWAICAKPDCVREMVALLPEP